MKTQGLDTSDAPSRRPAEPIASPRPFRYWTHAGIATMARLADIPLDRLFVDFDAIVEAYERGRPMVESMFGPDVQIGAPCVAGTGYGHVNTLGCRLVFPPDSEPGCVPAFDSLDQAVQTLQRPIDFASQGRFPQYLALWERLRKAYPQHKIPWTFGKEGPITTAWLLRGEAFFYDLYDQPDLCNEFLARTADSIVAYAKLQQQILETQTTDAAIADDVAALVSPALWPQMIVPHLERYFAALSKGPRYLHMERLMAEHLPFLTQLRITQFDPSVSPQLTPALIRDKARVPFYWRLNAMQVRDFSELQVRAFVQDAYADGANGLFCVIEPGMCTHEQARKVRVFLEECRKLPIATAP